jgi:hypothetical protein
MPCPFIGTHVSEELAVSISMAYVIFNYVHAASIIGRLLTT